jgi:septum formation protein
VSLSFAEDATGTAPTSILVLASASPRRAALLREAGIAFHVAPADVDESTRAGESAEAYVERLARGKAEAVWRLRTQAFVLGADTTVVAGEEILGKPEDEADAARMLRALSGRSHRVLTGVCLKGPSSFLRAAVVSTVVTFLHLSEADIAWYVGTGEPLDKAGAYAVQGGASRFVQRIDGSFSNVVGLPMELVGTWCREAGIQVS